MSEPNRSDSASALDEARAVADTILYEGYVLYPYRASAQKNRERFQFGVLMPTAYVEVDASEHSFSRMECLLECADDAELTVYARFLQVQRRTAPDTEPWDEAVSCEHELTIPVRALAQGPLDFPIRDDAADLRDQASDAKPGTSRRREALNAVLTASGERVAGPFNALKLSLRLENRTTIPDPAHGPLRTRSDALPYALVAAHLLVRAPGGSFISMVDPPLWAAEEVAACRNEQTWPVLAGPPGCRELVLSSPVILYDHPQLAPESPGDLYDATEIDEILMLRTLALTDAEKEEARATDPRAAAVIDRVDGIQPEILDRLHGAMRYLRAVTGPRSADPAARDVPGLTSPTTVPDISDAPDMTRTADVPWWDPGEDASVSPETDRITVGGVSLGRGSTVLMRPGSRRADAQDLFLAGRPATVEAVLKDVDGKVHLAVTPQDDPAADLNSRHGRFLYFAPDEVEPIGAST